MAFLGQGEIRRAVRSPITWGGLLVGLLWLVGLWRSYITSVPVMFRVDQVIAGAAVPPAIAAGLLVCIRGDDDSKAGAWLLSLPTSASERLLGWIAATVPLAVGGTALTVLGTLKARAVGGVGPPRPAVLLSAFVIVLLFAGIGSVTQALLPVRAASVVVVAAGVITVVLGRTGPSVQALSPWHGSYELSVASVARPDDAMFHLAWIAALTLTIMLLAFALVSKRHQRLLVGFTIACAVLAVATGAHVRRETLSTPPLSKIQRILSGTSAVKCNTGKHVRVCSLPGWEGWRKYWRRTAVGVLQVLPDQHLGQLRIMQSGVFAPSGLTQSYKSPPLPRNEVYVGLTLSDTASNVELAGSVAAWIVGRPASPRTPWTSGAIGPPPCFDSSDAATAGLWLLSRAEPPVQAEIVAAASDGRNYPLGAIQASPRAVQLTADLFSIDQDLVTRVIAERLSGLRQGRNDLAETLRIVRRKPVTPRDGPMPDFPVCI